MRHGSFGAYVTDECRCRECVRAFRNRKHGTQYAYYVVGCRCEQCKLYRTQGSPLPEDDIRHGTINAYRNLRCRCERCKGANTVAVSRYRQGLRRKD